jgi:hypothetical protein
MGSCLFGIIGGTIYPSIDASSIRQKTSDFFGHILGIWLTAEKCPDWVRACCHSVQRNFELVNLSDVPK